MTLTTAARLPEIYMRVIDPKKIAKLMAIQDVSGRELAKELGYASHTHLRRILSGETNTVTPDKAARMARFFGVGLDDLFVPRLSTDARQISKR